MMRQSLIKIGFVLPWLSLAWQANAQNLPATQNQIVIGMSTALSGSAQFLGQEMKRGVEAYFSETNLKGGINGKSLRLEALDDGYEPGKAGPNMRKLIDEHKVFAILGNVGTPTAVVSIPIANEKKVPFVGAFTGAGILRKSPPDRYIVNFRASYNQETANMVDGLMKDLGIKPQEIAIFTQNDAYGDAGFNGVVKALKSNGYNDVNRLVHGRYQRNTDNVEDGLSRILEARVTPKAVIMVGTYKACAKFVKLARKEKLDALFINVSFVGSEALLKELGDQSEGVIVTQVVPPLDSNLPAVKNYLNAIGSATPSFISLEGYLAAKAFGEGLRLAGVNPTGEALIDALEKGTTIDLGLGTTHVLSKSEHQFSQRVWPTQIVKGQYKSFQWADLRAPGLTH